MPSSSKVVSRNNNPPVSPPTGPRPSKKDESISWKEAWLNLSPWGYAKVLMALMLLAGASCWAAEKYAYYSGAFLDCKELEAARKKDQEMVVQSANLQAMNLNKICGGLSWLQRRKAVKIYTGFHQGYVNDWANAMMASKDILDSTAFHAGQIKRRDDQIIKILTPEQRKKSTANQ